MKNCPFEKALSDTDVLNAFSIRHCGALSREQLELGYGDVEAGFPNSIRPANRESSFRHEGVERIFHTALLRFVLKTL